MPGDTLGTRDVVLRSKPTQFLVLLPRQRDAAAVAARVLEAWRKTEYHKRFPVAYASEELDFEGADGNA